MALGCDNIDYRLRNAQFTAPEGVRSLGHADRCIVHSCSACWWWAPTCARTIRFLRNAVPFKRPNVACKVFPSTSVAQDWACRCGICEWLAKDWVRCLADIALAVAQVKGYCCSARYKWTARSGCPSHQPSPAGWRTQSYACWVMRLRTMAHAAQLLAWPNWIARTPGRRLVNLTEAANTVGASSGRSPCSTSGSKCWLKCSPVV